MVVDDLEFSREHSARVNVARVGLNALIVAWKVSIKYEEKNYKKKYKS